MRTIEKKSASKPATAAKANRATKTAKTAPKPLPGNPRTKGAALSAKVKASDAETMRKLAGSYGLPISIIAGVASSMGEAALRDEKLATITGRSSNQLLWMTINREAKDFTDTVPVMKAWPEIHLDIQDAKGMKREMDDWQGTLIHVGLRVMEANPDFALICYLDPIELYCKAVAHTMMS